jgi:HK97 gp10 family phage protein
MSIKTRLTTSGFSEYLEKIVKAGQDIDAIADEALAAGGSVLVEGMHRRVPKDTGNLDAHLAVSAPQQDGNFHFIEVGLLHGTDANTARYGAAQEFGTSHTPAQPYIRPTMDEDMRKARGDMKEVFVAKGAL